VHPSLWRYVRALLLEHRHVPGPTPSSRDVPEPDRASDGEADFRLVRAFLAHDPDATSVLAERLQIIPRILSGLCRRFRFPMTDDDLADVAQDAVAVALRKLDQLRPNVPLDAWLHRLCAYELSNALRRKGRVRAESLPDDLPGPETSAIDQLERLEMVSLAFDRLSSDEATVVRLHHLDGLTFAAIAARLGVTENTVKGRYYRGIAALSVVLRRHHPVRSEP
jgi:RNA polymerase sigma-70 factor (ECF subfamily)